MVLPEPPAVSAYSWQFHSREAGQRGEVQESGSQLPAPWGQGKHRFSSVLAPQGHSAPAGFVCEETKAAPVSGEWLGHLIGGSGSCFHTERDA